MQFRKYVSIVVTLVLGVVGVWLIGRPGELAPETVQRQQALAPFTTGLGQQTTAGTNDAEIIIHEPVTGSAIDLADLPPEVDNGDSMYQRWLRGEIDLDNEIERMVTPDQRAALIEASSKVGPSNNAQAPDNSLDGLMLEIGFPSLDINKCCAAPNQAVVPPDPELAVGPHHIIAVVNIAFEIYNKSGQIVTPNTTFANLFTGVSGCNNLGELFDPNVLYDEEANRFFLGIDSGGTGYCAAVSATPNPTGVWYRYRFNTTASGGFFDYPHAGVGRQAIFMGGNIFNCPTCGYRDSRVWAFHKWAMYNNSPVGVVERVMPGGISTDTPQPANLHGYDQGTWPTSGPHYIIAETNYNGSTYTVYAWNDPFGANSLFPTGTFNWTAATGNISPIFPPITAKQAGSSGRLQTNDWRPQDNEYRNGFLWTTSTITCNPGTGAVNCVRWAQVNPANGSIVQAGILASNGDDRYFGDVAANHCNDMALGYTKSNPSIFPSVFVAGRQGTDPPNTLQGETQLKAGEITYTAFDGSPFRWGDYTGMTSDPNGRDFWYLGQYSKNAGNPNSRWGTYIGCYSVPSCQPPYAAPDPSASPPPALPEGAELTFMPYVTYQLPACGYVPYTQN